MKKNNLLLLIIIVFTTLNISAQRPFITEWLTSYGSISFPSNSSLGTVNYNIKYYTKGDSANSVGTMLNRVGHTYITNLSSGPTDTIVVEITGDYPHFDMGNSLSFPNTLVTVVQWGDIVWRSFNSAFLYCINMHYTATDAPNLSQVTDMSKMFHDAILFDGDLSTWDVSNVTDMSDMFRAARSFNGDVSTWDVSNVTNMSSMFLLAESFNGDISTWDVSNVTDMNGLFSSAYIFNRDLSRWDVSSVTNMFAMFSNAYMFNNDLSSWNVSSVTNMTSMFQDAINFNSSLSSWRVSSVTSMSNMFKGASKFNRNLSNWDVSSVTDMSGMFYDATMFNGDISSWDVSNVRVFSHMFRNATSFNGEITSWDISSAYFINNMFNNASLFNKNISNWDVSSVVDMREVFYRANRFNVDLSNWDISNVAYLDRIFTNSNMAYCNMDATLNSWAPVLRNFTNMIGQIPAHSFISQQIVSELGSLISSATIITPPTLSLIKSSEQCEKETITITPQSSYSSLFYLWPDSSTSNVNTFVLDQDTSISVIGIDSYGCKKYDTLSVVVLPAPNVGLISNLTNNESCAQITATINAFGANTYMWEDFSTNTNTSFVLQNDTVLTVIGTGVNGCKNYDTLLITVFALPLVTISTGQATCKGTPILLNLSGAETYEWADFSTNSSASFVLENDTVLTVIGTDLNGCSGYDTLSVTAFPLPNVAISFTGTTCFDDTVTFIASGASSYEWMDFSTSPTSVIYLQNDTVLTVIGTTVNGCKGYDTLIVTTHVPPAVSLTSNITNNEACELTNVILTASGADSYEWADQSVYSAVTFYLQNDTTVTVKGVDINGCIGYDTLSITAFPLPLVEINTTQAMCLGTNATFTLSGADSYEWSDLTTSISTVFELQRDTVLTTIGTTINGCKGYDTLLVLVNTLPIVTLTSDATNNEACLNTFVEFTASGANVYEWNNIAGGSSKTIVLENDSIVIVKGTDVNGCIASDTLTVTTLALPIVEISADSTTICNGNSLELTASGAVSYLWNTQETNSEITINPATTTSYSVTGTDAKGCENTASVQIIVDECLSFEENNISFSVYPNPTVEYVIIQTQNVDYTNAVISLLDITGKMLLKTNLKETNTSISVANYPSGVYFIKIQSGKFVHTKKLVKY